MRYFLCLFVTFCFATLISGYTTNSKVIAAEEKSMEKDPVCSMEVSKDKALKADHEGKTYYFCSTTCEEAFKKNPSKYLKGNGK